MEHRITDIHCPQCGAPADFDIVRQMYVCGHCGGTVGISEAQKEKQGFRKLQREKLKNSVKKYRLFSTSCSGCGAEVVFEENEALSGCIALEIINIPKSTFRIGVRAFHNCQQLREIRLVDHIHMIEDGAFMECKLLEEIKLPASLKLLCRAAFAQCISLRKVQLNKNLKEIGDGAFCQCRSLREVEWNDSLRVIGTEAFLECKYLKTPVFDANVEIGKNAFKGCK